MKWKKPHAGDTRIVKKFLVLPLQICKEVRWLEFAKIEQHYAGGRWEDVKFLDK